MEENIALKKEFDFFIKNIDELIEKYESKYVVIKGEKVLGAYETIEEAILVTKRTEKMGEFLVKQCNPDKNSYSQIFQTRAMFKNNK